MQRVAAKGRRPTQRKGDTATAKAIHTFTAAGWDVAIPLTESAAYDLIVDDGAGLHRVQCKFTSCEQVGLRGIHSNAQGYVVNTQRPMRTIGSTSFTRMDASTW